MSDLKITDGDDTDSFQLDAALAREAALREELAKANGAISIANETLAKFADDLQAAEQRNVELATVVKRSLEYHGDFSWQNPEGAALIRDMKRAITK